MMKYRDIDRFSSASRPNKKTRFLMRDKLVHKECVSDSIHSWYNDLIEHHFLKADA